MSPLFFLNRKFVRLQGKIASRYTIIQEQRTVVGLLDRAVVRLFRPQTHDAVLVFRKAKAPFLLVPAPNERMILRQMDILPVSRSDVISGESPVRRYVTDDEPVIRSHRREHHLIGLVQTQPLPLRRFP